LTRSSALARASISLVVAVISRVEVADQRQQAVQPPASSFGQLQGREELASGPAEQVCALGQDPLAGPAARAPGS
jgi:hypothetical protein